MDGVVEDDAGLPMKQVPTLSFSFACTTWVSEQGVVRNRFYDAFAREWRWGAMRRAVFDARGRLGFNVYGRFRTGEQVIALAWIPQRRPTRRIGRVVRCEPSEAATAYNLRWANRGTDSSSESESDNDDDGEDRMPLEFKMGLVPCSNTGLAIDRRGRIYTPHGTFRGFFALGPCRFYPIPHVGLVPLNLVSTLMFTGERDRSLTTPPPRVKRVAQRLRRGDTISQIAREAGVRDSTVWSYAHTALQHMSTQTARRIAERMLHDAPDVLSAMSTLSTETPLVLSGRLSDVVYLMTRVFAGKARWREYPHRYSAVCLARAVLQREQ